MKTVTLIFILSFLFIQNGYSGGVDVPGTGIESVQPFNRHSDIQTTLVYESNLKLCQECKKEGKKSTVYQGGCMSTLAYCPEYWDEDGVYHYNNCNTTTCNYHCSEGHEWGESF